jgi:signal peptidase
MQSEEDKIIAPGMSNIYSFKLDNTGGMTVDYQMDLEVWLGNEDYSIPLDIRLSDENGNYLAGSADSWQSVSDMDRITDAGVMDAGSSKNYTLEWQWLFEEDNERDTTLGNQAVDDDITLTVSINTTAMADDGSEPIVEVTPTVEATPTVEVTPTVEATPTVEPTPTIQITPTVEILPTGDVPPTDYSAQMSDSLQNGETVPSGELPKTGDESPIIFYLLLALGAVAVLIVLLVLSKRKKQKIHSAALRRVMMVVFSILLGYNAYLANARGLAGNQIPMPFGVGFAVVLSGSMEPTLSTNDVLVVREAEDYNVGDIVVYQSGYELIVHRIISVDGDTIITQGDANNVADSPIEKSAIKGIVIAHVPAIGVLFNILKTPTGILLILLCAFLMMELSFRSQRASDDKELGEMKEEIRRLKEEQKNETDRKD